jgi:DNA invertase Pin-like site-specific DNA recombinase
MPVSERARGGALFVKLKAGDVVIAPKFDCLVRSALDALRVVEDLKKRGVSLHLLGLRGDISGNGLSKLFLTIAASFAEAERDRIRERTGQVKAEQKARGVTSVAGARSAASSARTAISSPTKTSRRPSPRFGACGPRGRRCGPSRRRCRRRASASVTRVWRGF